MVTFGSRTGVALALALTLAPASGYAQAPKEIRIGALFAFSGPFAFLGQDIFRGAEIASQMVNDRGGINGAKVVWEKADATTPAQAGTEAERLANSGIKIVFGTGNGGMAMVASQVLEREKVIFFEPGSAIDELTTRGFQYTFRISPPGADWARTMADFAVDRLTAAVGKTPADVSIAIKFEDGSFGTSMNNILAARLAERGIKKVSTESYSVRATDLSSLVLKLKAANPDIILSTDYTADATLFARQSKELGLQTHAIVGWSGIATPQFRVDVGDYADGMMSVNLPIDPNPAGLSESARQVRAEFRERYKKMTGKDEPPVFVVAGFDPAWALLNFVLPKAKAFEVDPIRDALWAVDEPVGSLTMGWGVKFSRQGEYGNHLGQNTRSIVGITQWQNGKAVMVYPDNLAAAKLITVK